MMSSSMPAYPYSGILYVWKDMVISLTFLLSTASIVCFNCLSSSSQPAKSNFSNAPGAAVSSSHFSMTSSNRFTLATISARTLFSSFRSSAFSSFNREAYLKNMYSMYSMYMVFYCVYAMITCCIFEKLCTIQLLRGNLLNRISIRQKRLHYMK